MARLLLAAAALAAGLAGCATTPSARFFWGNYDAALLEYGKHPEQREAYIAKLKAIIEAADQNGAPIPPGLCAEYGYALFEEGQGPEAARWFGRERDLYPESKVLMDKMIRNAGQRAATKPPGQPATTGPAGAANPDRGAPAPAGTGEVKP